MQPHVNGEVGSERSRRQATTGLWTVVFPLVAPSIVVLAAAEPLQAQAPSQPPVAVETPTYHKLRYEDDFTYLADPAKRSDPFDALKHIPLNAQGYVWLSIGGEARLRYERQEHERFDPDSTDESGYLLQRYLLHADLHLGSAFRLFGQLQASLEDGREDGPRGSDEDRLDLHQMFADLRQPLGSTRGEDVTLRVGRQELLYGSQRLVSVRESPNVRRSFDAARVLARTGALSIDAFVASPVEIDPGTFDDQATDGEALWGLYATCPAPFGSGAKMDLYYLGLQRDDAEFVQGSGDEHRHTFGTRLFGEASSWDFDAEGAFQVGTFGDGDVRAWMLATDAGYTFTDAATAPRVGMRADVFSGDNDASDPDLQTFDSLYPRGAYFGEIALIGPANLIDVHPSVASHLSGDLTLSFDWDFFWRESTQDGVYTTNGAILREGNSDARFVGHQPSVELEWTIDAHASAHFVYSHFFTGTFVEDTGPSSDVDFVGIWLSYRF